MTFLLGTATAAHQVEGNNTHSDFWIQENMEHTIFVEPSLDACDHYNRFEEDIRLMKEAGLNAYRFSIEWARIEPEMGKFDENEIAHYRKVLESCHENGIEPIVTMHHFSSPKWLITEGGWESEHTVAYFKNYCQYVAENLGKLFTYVCTINEANMGIQLAAIIKRITKQMESNIQVGINLPVMKDYELQMNETTRAFDLSTGENAHTFLSQRTSFGDELIMRAHEAARDAMKAVCPHLKVGLSLSLHDLQAADDTPETIKNVEKEWQEEFLHYTPYIEKDDFLGIQNYTREIIGVDGIQKAPENAELTQMNYEYYPEALENVIRKVAESFKGELLVTENGIGTADDERRVQFIDTALAGVKNCIADGIPVHGYMHWSLLDNFEWQKGYSMTFGLIAVDRQTQKRYPKRSLSVLGSYADKFA
ncbi:glycoside hydrolase family 1 protein [Trichococcus flocculiformis]|uniref:glycoside hydrolase family 1 protein n=1 Tax=Trichococcus flocculiformis TaxID=82803 RepID=UPI003DA46256